MQPGERGMGEGKVWCGWGRVGGWVEGGWEGGGPAWPCHKAAYRMS